MFIDVTYFFDEINIPQIAQPEVSEQVSSFIKKYENKFLLNYFGYDLKKEIEDNPTDPIIGKIINGTTVTKNDDTLVWVGLQNDDKVSPIANYVFYYFLEDKKSSFQEVGEIASKAENAMIVSADYRLSFAWNEMVELLEPLEIYLEQNFPNRSGSMFKSINPFNL